MKGNRSRKLLALFLALSLSLSAFSVSAYAVGTEPNAEVLGSTATAPAATSELTPAEKAIVDFKTEVIRLVNVERSKQGVAPLATIDTLTQPADLRARETAQSFSHTRPDGTKCFTVFGQYSLQYKAAGENLAYGFKTPEAVVKAWMDSSGHKANILDPSFTYIGIGYYKNENGRIYCSQLFYTPKPAEVQ